MTVCLYLWSVISSSIFLSFWYSGYSRHSGYSCHKSSDLFMINPHFSLNPQNSWISCAILRFHEDFHCEIHRFHEQSSDLVEDFIKSLLDLRVHSSALSESQCDDLDRLPFTQSPLTVPLSSQNCNVCSIESWIFLNTDLSLLNFYSIHPVHHEILHGLRWNPWIYL